MDEAGDAERNKKKRRLLPVTGDSEPEQAIKIRLPIGLGIFLYFGLPWGPQEQFLSTLLSTPSLITLAYYIGAIAIAAAIFLNPQPSPSRRIAGIWLDLTSLSVLMFYSGDESVFLFVIYLWVILGNGFRYGSTYLYISSAVGLLGFTTALLTGSYWEDIHHKPIGYSLLLLLILIPLYSAFLINKLHVAIRDAKLANEAKSRFLANMSHELRTPLNGVIGIADLLGETSLNKQQHEFVNIMRNSANTLLGLIENVLDISKIEAGKINISKEPFDLHGLLNTIIQLQRAMAESKGLQLAHYIDSRIDFNLMGDAQHLRQVLINLIGNAIKFTDSGNIKLVVRKVGTDTINSAAKVRFEVSDTGIGISDEYIGKIFEDFTQANNTGAAKYQGTGLGTTISKQLVELMGGEIGVKSELGKGTTFWFELPFDPHSENTLELTDQNVLIFTREHTAVTLQQSLNNWQIPHQAVHSTAQVMTALMNALADDRAFTTLIIEQQAMSGITPAQYALLLSQEPQLEHLSLILVQSPDEVAHDDELNLYYLSAIADVGDKRSVFNALHAVEASHLAGSNVVSLQDFYHAQANNQRQLTIMVAEDNQVNQRVLEGMLSQLGHRVLLAANGEQAMELISHRYDEIDLMILDMNMPEYSGTEVLQALSFINTARDIPAIMLTADATPEARRRCEEAGAALFLTKPINSKELLSHIASFSKQLPISEHSPSNTGESTEEELELINYRHFKELESLGGGVEFLANLVDGFVEDGRKHLGIINEAINDDYYQYRESLHALKGTSTEIGAQILAELCRQAEHLKPNQLNSTEMHNLVDDINRVFEETLQSLQSTLQTLAYQTKQ